MEIIWAAVLSTTFIATVAMCLVTYLILLGSWLNLFHESMKNCFISK